MVLKALAGNSFLRFLSLRKSGKYFFISSILRKLEITKTSIKNRHKRKLQRDNVNVVTAGKNQRKNRLFSRNQLERKNHEKRKRNKCSFKERTKKIKENSLDQNVINLSTRDLTPSLKSVLAKGPTFIPTPTNVNWFDLSKNFDKFANQLRHEFKKHRTQHQEQGISPNNKP